MDRSFEHTVLAYLDGLLDKREEREFLKEVSRSAEKRAVLEQFRTLDKTLKNKSVPLAVPLKVQRALADQIPALKDVLPPAAGGAITSTGGAITSASSTRFGWLNRSASYFSRRIVSLMLIGGATVTLISTLILTGTFATDDSADKPGTESSRYVTEESTRADARIADAGTRVSEDGARISDAGEQSAGADDRSVSDAGDQPTDAGDQFVRGGKMSVQDTPAGAGQPTERYRTRERLQTSDNTLTPSRVSGTLARAAQHTSADHAADVPTGFERSVEVEVIPLVATPLPHRETSGVRDYPPAPKSLGELLGGSVHAYLETGAADVRTSGSGGNRASTFDGVYLLGLRADLSPRFALGAEIGQSTFAREALVSRTEALAGNSETRVIIIDDALQSATQPWLRFQGLYTLNPASRLRFQGDLGVGLLLVRDSPVMWSAGFSSLYSLTYALHLRAGIHYSGAWMSPVTSAPVVNTSNTGVVGIIRNAESAGTVYSSSIEFRIGFGILLW